MASGATFVPSRLALTLADDEVAPDALAHILETIHAHHGLVARGEAWNLHVARRAA